MPIHDNYQCFPRNTTKQGEWMQSGHGKSYIKALLSPYKKRLERGGRATLQYMLGETLKYRYITRQHVKRIVTTAIILLLHIFNVLDIDECQQNPQCDIHAACSNTDGSFVCHCHTGYIGNGTRCLGKKGQEYIRRTSM